jgi:arabinose-5-phosphate isomerase
MALPAHKDDDSTLVAAGLRALAIESRALAALQLRVGSAFAAACRLCLACTGRVVVSGMGKSGHVGGKIAATLASTGNPVSTLGRSATVHLDVSVPEEACPLNLAPTASTTATLAMGDALAVALLEARGFTAEDFARSHPGGSLGRRLLLHVEDVMRRGADVPRVAAGTSLAEGLLEMSRKGLGMCVVVDESDRVLGVYTDGDLRRSLDRRTDLHAARMAEVMTRDCKRIGVRDLAAEAVHLMETHRITALPVVDGEGRLAGALNVHDLLRSGVV